ncbi:MAG: peptidase C39 family protein [Candidatus Nanoarchaeia archaeon]|nr:peptidase C39 family protein [Candidatus Nanoarchaeia archaeon]
MRLNVPFYPITKEEKNFCGQAVLKSILKYFSDKEYDLNDLAKKSEKIGSGFTLTIGLAYAALNEGLKVKYITTCKEDEELVSDKDVPNVEDYYEGLSLKYIQEKARGLLENSKRLGLKSEHRKPIFEEIINEIKLKHPVIVLIDYGKIYKNNKQVFHFVIVTGYDNKNVYFHDVGPNNPIPHKQIPKELFLEAWSAKGTDMDTLIFSK